MLRELQDGSLALSWRQAKYDLWITGAEKTPIARILTGCPTQQVPVG
jgi:hypothetical protein